MSTECTHLEGLRRELRRLGLTVWSEFTVQRELLGER